MIRALLPMFAALPALAAALLGVRYYRDAMRAHDEQRRMVEHLRAQADELDRRRRAIREQTLGRAIREQTLGLAVVDGSITPGQARAIKQRWSGRVAATGAGSAQAEYEALRAADPALPPWRPARTRPSPANPGSH